jgi:hypothetical protein
MTNNKNWYAVEGKHDSEYQEFVNEIREVISQRIINQIRHHDDLKIMIGPHDLNNHGSRTPVLFILNMRGLQLEVTLKDRSNCSNPRKNDNIIGFTISTKDNHVYTLPGLICYINEYWIPRQDKTVRRAKNRQDAADELSDAMKGFTSDKYKQEELTPLLFSAVKRYYSKISDTKLEYYIITDKKNKKLLQEHSTKKYWELRLISTGVRFIWVCLKKGQNMAQVGYFYPSSQTTNYSGNLCINYRLIKSSWFSPKNLVPQLDKLAGKASCLATLLANPDLKGI